LGCADGDVSWCNSEKSKCKERKGTYLGKKYDTCPVRALTSDPELMYVLQLERQMIVNPISDWPDGWAAWVCDLMSMVVGARKKRQHDAMKSAQASSKG